MKYGDGFGFLCEYCRDLVNYDEFIKLSDDPRYTLFDETFIIHILCNENMKRLYSGFHVLASLGSLNLVKVSEE